MAGEATVEFQRVLRRGAVAPRVVRCDEDRVPRHRVQLGIAAEVVGQGVVGLSGTHQVTRRTIVGEGHR